MAYLFTKHDPFHIHKLLGFTALLHFLCRFVLALCTGTAFPDSEPAWSRYGFLLVHVALHATSFVFRLPNKRNFKQPMIWPEFRLHNAVFAYRNLIGTAVALLNLWPSNPVLAVVTKAALVLGACLAADACTSYIGDRERRTTNAMPYPDHAPAEGMKWTKLFYARAQFYAAMWAISGMATMSFLCVFAIEIASFLMTLVRKGWIAPLSYHRAYYFALWIMWPVVIASMAFGVLDAGHVCTVGATTKAIYMARVKGRVSKYILWPLGAAIAAIGLLYVPTGLLSQPLLCVITIATGLEYVYCSRWLLQREPRAGAATTSVSAAPGSASAPGKSREHEAPQPSWQRTLGRLVSCERVRRMASGH